MKKYLPLFLTVLLLSFVGFTGSALAQGSSCTVITESNYNSCCLPGEYSESCDRYEQTRTPSDDPCKGPYADAYVQCAKPGQIGGGAGTTVPSGTLKSNSVFTEQELISGNPNVSPQSSSAVLASCSAIKFKSLLDILVWVKCVITSIIIPLIFTFAFLFFLWNVIRFMNASESKNKEEAKERMWWGIIALFVMLSVWGIIKILSNTLGIEPSVPLLQTKTYLDPAKANKGK